MAEALAIRKVARYAQLRCLQEVTIESDSKVAIERINGSKEGHRWEIMVIIEELQMIKKDMPNIIFKHVRREQNKAAHWLSKNEFAYDMVNMGKCASSFKVPSPIRCKQPILNECIFHYVQKKILKLLMVLLSLIYYQA